MANVALLEPYHTGSHAAWADEFCRFTSHTATLFALPGRFWKWRMHGAAVTLATQYQQHGGNFDLILASDMLDLTTFQALTRRSTASVPYVLYFHENQLTYPFPPNERRDLHYGFINYASALAADRVLFNSDFHRTAFLSELPRLLKHFPDYSELWTVDAIARKSEVLALGVNLRRFDRYRLKKARAGSLHILWNHRWEYDKQPDISFEALYALKDAGMHFEVIVVGENFRQRPDEFREAQDRLAGHIQHFGYVKRFADYARLLWEADLQVSTAIQDFFGSSTCEAIYCNCVPVLPNRLNYPTFIPEQLRAMCLYDNDQALVERLRWACQNVGQIRNLSLRTSVEQYDWGQIIHQYDQLLTDVIKGQAR